MTMTAVQLQHPPPMIPGAFEPDVRPFRNTRAASSVPAVSLPTVRPDAATESTPFVIAAPYRPTTALGWFAAALGDVVLCAAVVVGLVMVPALAVQAIVAAGSFILATLGWK